MDAMNKFNFINTLKENKRKLVYGVAGLLLIIGAAAIAEEAAEQYFEVKGVVTAVNNNQVTVSGRWIEQTVDFSDSFYDTSLLTAGQHVKIERNLQGKVIELDIKKPHLLPPHKPVKPLPKQHLQPAGHPLADGYLAQFTPATIASVNSNMLDDDKVIIEGTLINRLDEDTYTFADKSGAQITVEADDYKPLPLNEQVRLYGKTDVKKDYVELDIKFIEPVI